MDETADFEELTSRTTLSVDMDEADVELLMEVLDDNKFVLYKRSSNR